MVELLSRIFIKNRNNVNDPEVRKQYGMLCGMLGIFLNILMTAGKFVAGLAVNSVAITADAANNLSDAASSGIVMIGFKLSGKKPDPDHPFGHGRIEYISGLIVSMLIIFMSVELVKTAIDKIIHPEVAGCSTVVIVILSISVAVKLYMFFYNKRVGKKIKSAAMEATAADSVSDAIATSVTLASAIIGQRFNIAIDGWVGVLVSLLVFKAGYEAMKDTVSPLLGMPPEKEFVDEVTRIMLSHEEIIGVHDMVVHNYGPGRVFVSAHAEVPGDGDIMELHDVIDRTEFELAMSLNCEAVLHMDPVCVNDDDTDRYKELTRQVLQEYDERITFHDFRIVKGPTHTNIMFDLVVPFSFEKSDEQIQAEVFELIQKKDPTVFIAIKVDKDYVKRM